jgi:hypothetical protein
LEEVRRTHGDVCCFMGFLIFPVSMFLEALPLGSIFSETNVPESLRPQILGVDRKRASWGQDALVLGDELGAVVDSHAPASPS